MGAFGEVIKNVCKTENITKRNKISLDINNLKENVSSKIKSIPKYYLASVLNNCTDVLKSVLRLMELASKHSKQLCTVHSYFRSYFISSGN